VLCVIQKHRALFQESIAQLTQPDHFNCGYGLAGLACEQLEIDLSPSLIGLRTIIRTERSL